MSHSTNVWPSGSVVQCSQQLVPETMVHHHSWGKRALNHSWAFINITDLRRFCHCCDLDLEVPTSLLCSDIGLSGSDWIRVLLQP